MSITVNSAGTNHHQSAASSRLLPAAIPGGGTATCALPFQPSISLQATLRHLLDALGEGDNLRTLRNRLLGHEALKRFLVERGELVERLASFIGRESDGEGSPIPANDGLTAARDRLHSLRQQREAVVILGSIAYGGPVELAALLRNSIPQRLLSLVVRQIPKGEEEENLKLRESSLRALRTIYRHGETPRELPFHPQLLPVLTQLLASEDFSMGGGGGNGRGNNASLGSVSTGKSREYCAVMLANCCDNPEKQAALGRLGALPIALRMAISRGGSLSTLEASLDLLASLTKDNRENCQALVHVNASAMGTPLRTTESNHPSPHSGSGSGPGPHPDPVSFLFEILTKRMSAEVRIFAAICLSNLCRGGLLSTDARIVKILLPSLISLLGGGDAGAPSVRARAAEVLALLMSDSERLQIVACDGHVIGRLAGMLAQPASEEERKAALLALAAIASFKEECRRLVIEAKVLPLIVQAMEAEGEAVRAAACQATRSLSRSVKNLRTTLVDAGMCTPLMRLLEDPSMTVQKTACAALCNLVLDFSPMKEAVLREGGVSRLVHLTESPDPELRGNALWALKNLLYLADTPIKLATMEQLTFERLARLADDPQTTVQEQALNLLRNLVCEKEADISEVLSRVGETRLIALIEHKMRSGDGGNKHGTSNAGSTRAASDSSSASVLSPLTEDIIMHALYVVANACTAASSAPKDAVMASQPILERINGLLQVGTRADLQVAALWCVINLTWTEDAGSEGRIAQLRRLGIERRLEHLMAAAPLAADVRDRVQTALNNFSSPVGAGSGSGLGGSGGSGSGVDAAATTGGTRSSSRRQRTASNGNGNGNN